jgi:low affinity Fe/Cu permease
VAFSLVLVVFMVANAIAGFAATGQGTFASVSSVIVVILLFALEHTPNRQPTALPLRLDEIILTLLAR